MKPTDKLILVEWLDSHILEGWTREKPEAKPVTCHSAGWVVAEDYGAVVIAPHMTQEDEPQMCGVMTIPRLAIVKMTPLSLEEQPGEEQGEHGGENQ